MISQEATVTRYIVEEPSSFAEEKTYIEMCHAAYKLRKRVL